MGHRKKEGPRWFALPFGRRVGGLTSDLAITSRLTDLWNHPSSWPAPVPTRGTVRRAASWRG